MASVKNSYDMQMTEPGLRATAGLTRLSTTLSDMIAVLQTVVEPDQDNLVVAVVVHWLRSGRLAFI
jgi:hypothetical protein